MWLNVTDFKAKQISLEKKKIDINSIGMKHKSCNKFKIFKTWRCSYSSFHLQNPTLNQTCVGLSTLWRYHYYAEKYTVQPFSHISIQNFHLSRTVSFLYKSDDHLIKVLSSCRTKIFQLQTESILYNFPWNIKTSVTCFLCICFRMKTTKKTGIKSFIWLNILGSNLHTSHIKVSQRIFRGITFIWR